MSDSEKKDNSVAAGVGGAAAAFGVGYHADKLAKERMLKNLISTKADDNFYKLVDSLLPKHNGDYHAAENAARDEMLNALPGAQEMVALHDHPAVVAAVRNTDKLHNAHHIALISAGHAESIVFAPATGGTYTMKVKLSEAYLKGIAPEQLKEMGVVDGVLEMHGVKTLPAGVKAGEPVTGQALSDLAKTFISTHWLEEVSGLENLWRGEIAKVTITQVNGKNTAIIELTAEAAEARKLASATITKEIATLPHGVTIPQGGSLVMEGESLSKLFQIEIKSGDLLKIFSEVREHGIEAGYKSIREAASKILGTGFGFKHSGAVGKAGIIAAGVAGAAVGGKLLGSIFASKSHADRVAEERTQAEMSETHR